MCKRIFIGALLPLLLFYFTVFVSAQDRSAERSFGAVMYVNAASGLRIRNAPSVNSEVRGTLSYGQAVVIGNKSGSPVTIDRITDYWYELHYGGGWVFGGYLSENLPPNVPVILGFWEVEGNRRIMYVFNKDSYSIGLKESEWFDNGTWVLNGNVLIFTQLAGAYEDLDTPEIRTAVFLIINTNQITLRFNDGSLTRLIRCRNVY